MRSKGSSGGDERDGSELSVGFTELLGGGQHRALDAVLGRSGGPCPELPVGQTHAANRMNRDRRILWRSQCQVRTKSQGFDPMRDRVGSALGRASGGSISSGRKGFSRHVWGECRAAEEEAHPGELGPLAQALRNGLGAHRDGLGTGAFEGVAECTGLAQARIDCFRAHVDHGRALCRSEDGGDGLRGHEDVDVLRRPGRAVDGHGEGSANGVGQVRSF